ncbi:MAG: peptide chain release factor N(5)-glutamine methyltransferase [Gammaproteobacteria bacterium]
MTHSIKSLLTSCTEKLSGNSQSARLDTEVLLMRVLDKDRAFLFANPEHELSQTELEELDALINERCRGVPVAHLTGKREFWTLELAVTSDVLVPRPETELLVEEALRHIPGKADCRVVDLGCGSGAIALALASERPLAEITATDRSKSALEIARRNAATLELEEIRFVESDWLAELRQERFNIIVSNPPYVATSNPELAGPELKYEPEEALYSGKDGLDDIRTIISSAPEHLYEKGWLLLEHGFDQAEAIHALMHEAGFTKIECYKDLAGHDRVSVGQLQQIT